MKDKDIYLFSFVEDNIEMLILILSGSFEDALEKLKKDHPRAIKISAYKG
jgi:hypothetical protein